MSRFTDYAAATTRGLVLVWRVELISTDGRILCTNERPALGSDVIRWGAELRPIAWANDRVSDTNATLNVLVTDQRLVPDLAGSLLHPDTGNLVRLSAGFRTAGDPVWYTIATLAIEAADAEADAGVAAMTLNLVDRARPLQSETETVIPFDAGQTVESLVSTLASQVLEGPYSISPTGYTLPSGSIQPGANRQTTIDKLLGGCGHELVTDANGLVSSQPIPATSSGAGERWVYGDTGYNIQNVRREWSTKTPQAWRVEGGSFQNTEEPLAVTVYDTDPQSQGYHDGRKAPQVRSSSFPWVRTRPQAAAAGYGQMRRHGDGRMIVTFSCAPNPSMRKNDLVELTVASLNIDGVFRVIGSSLPVHAEGTMQVVARHSWDPQLNFRGVDGVDGSPVGSISDDFNRANQNLEDTNEGGSIDWTEFGYSWAVVGDRAVQRYANGWSFARHNSPLTSSDQTVSILAYPTAGRPVGPMARSDGDNNGYAAIIDTDGLVRLVSWRNGSIAGTLGTYRQTGSVQGTELELVASGNTLTVNVGGTERISTSIVAGDAQRVPTHSGTYVGMLAFGGHGSSAPAADDFTATAN